MSRHDFETDIVSDADKVRVIVRCRPMNENEVMRGDLNIVNITDDTTLEVEAPGNSNSGMGIHKRFRFNRCLGADCSQENFFNECGIQQLLDSALNGYAATVFAYGQTGSGKTYSVSGLEEKIAEEEWSGDPGTDGIIPRSLEYLFNYIHQTGKTGTTYTCRASYCEIYNEQVYDLLNLTSGNLAVRWNVKSGFFVQDLFVVECDELADVMAVVSEGHRNRRVGSHELNKDSSRSHSILTFHVESETIDSHDGHTMVKFGKVCFVDLAGSERLKDTRSEGQTLKETGAINQSLFTLGKVIASLSDKKRKTTFVPYRDSKLTKLLMDSLGGTSMTLMIACCSPSEKYLEETLSTLKYATRARSIENKPVLRVDPKEQLIYNLRREAKLLKMENSYLRKQLKMHGITDIPGTAHSAIAGSGGGGSESTNVISKVSSARTPSSQLPPGITLSPSRGGGRHTSGGNMVGLLAEYQREIERLKQENREVRAKSGVSERGYRAVMVENERLCGKLEHLEEIFVHDSGDAQWPNAEGKRAGDRAGADREKESMVKRIKFLEGMLANRSKEEGPGDSREIMQLQQFNIELQRKVKQLQHREADLLRALNGVGGRRRSVEAKHKK